MCSFTENPSVTTDNATLLYAVPGSSLQLVVNILGDPVPRADQIIWYRNDTLITIQDQQLIISHDRTQLTIMNVATQYYGVYRCNVMTNAGTRSQSFHIKRPCKSVIIIIRLTTSSVVVNFCVIITKWSRYLV